MAAALSAPELSIGPAGLQAWLSRAHPAMFALYAGTVAFAAYSSMYAFRKPFAAATYADAPGWHGLIDFKVALVIAQVAGYALAKIVGVKVVSEMAPTRRGVAIVGLIVAAWAALVLFAIVPPIWKVAALFLNGLPLGMIWGLVFGYVEGRRTSEAIAAILCASFIVSSGFVKSIGLWLVTSIGVSEYWMPAATGALVFPLLVVAVAGLARLPPPTAGEQAERMARPPMPAAARRAFMRDYGPGVILLVIAYMLFTAIRDFRDNFAAEIWHDLGYAGVSSVFTASELPIAIVTLGMLASLGFIRGNLRALVVIHAIIVLGGALLAASTLAFQMGWLSPIGWMILSGLGLYLGYTPFNAMLFDRLVAATRRAGTAGFLIYVADAAGYGASVMLMLLRNLPGMRLDWLHFFIWLTYGGAATCVLMALASLLYFRRRLA